MQVASTKIAAGRLTPPQAPHPHILLLPRLGSRGTPRGSTCQKKAPKRNQNARYGKPESKVFLFSLGLRAFGLRDCIRKAQIVTILQPSLTSDPTCAPGSKAPTYTAPQKASLQTSTWTYLDLQSAQNNGPPHDDGTTYAWTPQVCKTMT